MANAQWASTARNWLLGLVTGVAVCLAVGGRSAPQALAQTGSGTETAGTIAFTSGGSGSSQCLYVIDTKEKAFAVYRLDPQNTSGAVKLMAARQYRWDLKLAEFNNQAPDVASIESMVNSPHKGK